MVLLYLGNNDLDTLPREPFTKLKKLQLIDLSDNQFSEIPEVLYELNETGELINIKIGHNKLLSISEKIHVLKKVKDTAPTISVAIEDFGKKQWLEIENNFLKKRRELINSVVEVMVVDTQKNRLLTFPIFSNEKKCNIF